MAPQGHAALHDHPPPPDSDLGHAYWRAASSHAAPQQAPSIGDAEFRLLAENLPTLCSIADATGAVIWLNRRWYDYCGTTPAEMQGTGWHKSHDPAQLPAVLRRWRHAVATGEPFETVVPLRGNDGVFRPFLTRAWPMLDAAGKPKLWFGVAAEIGAQIAAETALQAEAVAHAALIEAQQEVAATRDLDTMLQAVARGAMAVSPMVDGAAVELLDGDSLVPRATAGRAILRQETSLPLQGSLSGLCVREARPCLSGNAQSDPRAERRHAREAAVHSIAVVPLFRRDAAVGVLKLMSGTPDAFTNRDVAVAQLLAGTLAAGFADVGEAEAEAALQESEARYQVITNAVDPLIWSAAPDGRTDYYNARWYDFVGMPKAGADVDLWTAVVHPEDWLHSATRWGHSVATGEPFEIEYRLRHHSGQYRWALGRATLMRDAAGRPQRWYGTCIDIHDRRTAESALRELNDTLEHRVAREVAERTKAEDALRQSQKMEAVGQLTGGIAHDFNNLLTVITGNIDTAMRAVSSAGGDARAQRALEGALNGAERAASLTQRLLAFARRQPLAPRAVDVGRLVGGMSDLLKRALGETIKLETASPPDLWRVEADPNQLENALLNLAVNARDAMPGGGRLMIRCHNDKVDAERAARHNGLSPGEYVVAAVADTGTGMSPDVISRAFEPFFTTKEIGRGTGLGLSQVYGFVKQSGGYVMIDSEPGHGTEVKICLPRLHGFAADEIKPVLPAPAPAHRSETILVVEDDDDVRAYTVECLRDLGYNVVQAASGAAALLRLADAAHTIDLLFTDVVMPGMSGRELAQTARATKPGLKVLYTSGYTRDAILPGNRSEAGIDMIPKPFTYAGVAAKLRDLLDG